MSDVNIVTVMGRLVRDPIIRSGDSGQAWGVFTLASNYHYKDKGGAFQEETAFVPGKAFGCVANSLAKHKKGDIAIATGRLKTESWEKNGQNQSQLTLVCDSLKFVVPQNGSSPSGSGSDSAPHANRSPEKQDGEPPF